MNGSFATVIGGSYRRLDASTAASGPHVFAVRVSAVRQGHINVHRNPPLVVTMADAPEWDGMAIDMPRFSFLEKRNIFDFGS